MSQRIRVLLVLMSISCAASAADRDVDGATLAAVRCAACHGNQGLASNPQWPHLAGQKKSYLARQLQAFRDGTRRDAVMSPVASELSDAEIEALTTWYRRLDVTAAQAADPAGGRNAAAVCTACHGARGISGNEEWPKLAGQQAAYLKKQLLDYRDGRRDSLIMARVVRGLSDAQIDLLAGYFSSLPSRKSAVEP